MSEIEINKNPDLLFNKIERRLGEVHFDNFNLPNFLTENLNQNFALRPYQELAFKSFLTYFENGFDFKELPLHLLFNMATGSGKTLIMAGCILYLYKQGYRKFLFFSTSNPIIEKTKGNFLDLFSNKYLFNQKINIDGKNIEIKQIDVFDEADEDNINIKFTTIHKLHSDLSKDAENSLNFNDLKDQKIVLIGDECHHFNKKTKGNKNKENKQLEFTEILKDEKNWEATIEKILNSNNENILLEYTATIDWNNENIRNKYLSKCLIKYDLKEFRENGYSKEIKLFQSDAGIEKEDLILQAIIINQYKQDIATDHNLNIKPIILFKANKTIAESKENEELFNDLISNLDQDKINNLRDLAIKNKDYNILSKIFNYYDAKDKNYNNLIRNIKSNFAKNKLLNVNEYAFDGKKQNTKNYQKFESETKNQENILNSLEDIDNEIRAIFAVDKLNEGWDVLNLFDIVRLYNIRDSKDNKAGKTTIAEAQLIGRGARYYPFYLDHREDKFQRKFDSGTNNPLRILEILHYHSVYNSRYISELTKELIRTGAMDDKEGQITRKIKIKESFKKEDLYKDGFIFLNERKPTNYKEYKIWQNLSFIKGEPLEYDIYSGKTKEELALIEKERSENIAKKDSKLLTISQIDKNILDHLLNEYDFFDFNNLNKYIKDKLKNNDDFRQNYLNDLKIRVKGLKSDLENLSQDNLYKIGQFALNQIEEELKNNITHYQGTKEFKRKKMIKDAFDDRDLNFSKKDNDKLKNEIKWQEFSDQNDWLIYDKFFGTSEEESLLEFIKDFIDDLKKKYEDVKLIRNERSVEIYSFKEGQRFEPDFILILKEKSKEKKSIMHYQLFIEPKGNHLKDNKIEQWKSDFLQEMKNQSKDKIIEWNNHKKFKLIGLDFYNKENRGIFEKEFKEELNI
jgi:type III restriction enzyme